MTNCRKREQKVTSINLEYKQRPENICKPSSNEDFLMECKRIRKPKEEYLYQGQFSQKPPHIVLIHETSKQRLGKKRLLSFWGS